MSLRVPELDLRSFLLVLFAFIGNAAPGGVDLVLTVVLPIALLLQFRSHQLVPLERVISTLGIGLILITTVLLASKVGVPYFEGYYLWPVKAAVLMALVALGPEPTWPAGNMLALSLLALLLIAVGDVQNGRLHSLFGPNMLYRLFGMLLLFALMGFFSARGMGRLLNLLIVCFGVYSMLLTGSSGALVVLIVAAAFFLYRLSRKVSLALLAMGLIVISSRDILYPFFLETDDVPSFLARAIAKISAIEVDTRLVGWIEILSKPFSLEGYKHADFANIWGVGYQYPHNIVVELYAFYGIAGFAIIVLILMALLRSWPRVLSGNILSMTFVVLLTGAMLSGDLSDNYGVVALAAGIVLRPFLPKQDVGTAV